MPRPRKPLHLLKLTGADRKNPQRYRHRGPEPDSGDPIDPEPPDWMNAREQACYRNFIQRAPDLWRTDFDIAVMIALLTAEMESDFGKFPAAKLRLLLTALVKCGCTPAARSAMGISTKPPTDKSSEFDKFR